MAGALRRQARDLNYPLNGGASAYGKAAADL
jgi:hypothetical protein